MVKKLTKLLTSFTLSIALVLTSLINTAGALSITNVTSNQGSIEGGTEVTIEGEFEKYLGMVQITSGIAHSCALDTFGKAYCWGVNNFGQLGNNSTVNSLVPVAVDDSGVLDGKKLSTISAGGYQTCALDEVGQAYCWGYNNSGQLGIGSTANSPVPVKVSTTGVLANKVLVKITVGNSHVCALDEAGLAYCWGSGQNGELGNNITANIYEPVAVNMTGVLSGKKVEQIGAGSFATCIVSLDKKVYCWGGGGWGVTGNGLDTPSLSPVDVGVTGLLAGKNIKTISVGHTHVCVLDSEGVAYCWGSNKHLGNGGDPLGFDGDGCPGYPMYEQSPGYWVTVYAMMCSFPVAVDNSGVLAGKNLVGISAGSGRSCVVDSAGKLYCWGGYSGAGFGDGSGETQSLVPVEVDMLGVLAGKSVVQVVSGNYVACALDTVGQIYCWGTGYGGALGNNDVENALVPICVHTTLDGTGSALPGLGCGRELTITMDINGEPSPCTNIVIAKDGQSLTCTTSAHTAGIVDVTINDGVNTVTLANGYEYIDNNNKEDKKPPAINVTPPNTGLTTTQRVAVLSILTLLIISTTAILVRRYIRTNRTTSRV